MIRVKSRTGRPPGSIPATGLGSVAEGRQATRAIPLAAGAEELLGLVEDVLGLLQGGGVVLQTSWVFHDESRRQRNSPVRRARRRFHRRRSRRIAWWRRRTGNPDRPDTPPSQASRPGERPGGRRRSGIPGGLRSFCDPWKANIRPFPGPSFDLHRMFVYDQGLKPGMPMGWVRAPGWRFQSPGGGPGGSCRRGRRSPGSPGNWRASARRGRIRRSPFPHRSRTWGRHRGPADGRQ